MNSKYDKRLAISNGVTLSVYVPDHVHTENQEVVLALVTYTREGRSCTTTSVTLNEKQTSELADVLNAALGHAWPKEW